MPDTFLITVSGSRGGAGKTRLIERLLPCLGNCAAIKARIEPGEELRVVAEDDPSQSPGKDTGRYLAAGARRAFLLTGGRDEVTRAVKRAVAGGEFDVVVVESNSLAAVLESDLSLFVRAEGEPKPGAETCERLADVIVCAVSAGARRTEGEVMQDEENARISEAVKRESTNGTIACRTALQLAERLGVEPRLIGQEANRQRIKIISCQLGCF